MLQSRVQRHDLDIILPDNMSTAKQLYLDLKAELMEANLKHREIRETELKNKIKLAISTGKHTEASYLRTISHQETQRKTWQTLKFVRKPSNNGQTLDRIDVPTSWPDPNSLPTHDQLIENPSTATSWKTVTQPDEIDFYLRLRNRTHFGQA